MENTTPKLGIIESDPWLEPYSAAIEGRHQHALDKELELTGGKGTLSDFATGYLYFGLHRTRRGWVFREWAPNAKEIYLIGDFNDWKEHGDYRMGYTAREDLPEADYDADKDISFYPGLAESYIPVKPGMFAIFFPQDAHAPGVSPDGVKKVIVKVLV